MLQEISLAFLASLSFIECQASDLTQEILSDSKTVNHNVNFDRNDYNRPLSQNELSNIDSIYGPKTNTHENIGISTEPIYFKTFNKNSKSTSYNLVNLRCTYNF